MIVWLWRLRVVDEGYSSGPVPILYALSEAKPGLQERVELTLRRIDQLLGQYSPLFAFGLVVLCFVVFDCRPSAVA